MSAPHLPGILDVRDFYGGGNMLGSPDLDQCLLVAGGRGGGGKDNVGGALGGSRPSSKNGALSSAYSGNESDDSNIMLRPSTDGGRCRR